MISQYLRVSLALILVIYSAETISWDPVGDLTHPDRILRNAEREIRGGGSSGQDSGVIEQPSIAASSVVIVSKANRLLNFSVRPADGEWGKYSLESGKGITISCDGCTTSHFELAIATEGRQVVKTLNPTSRYVLYWNSNENLWDVGLP